MLMDVISVLNLVVLINVVSSDQEIGDVCILTNTTKEGKCVLLKDCQQATKSLTKTTPQRCGFQGTIPIVCCSVNNTIPIPAQATTPTTEVTAIESRITGLVSQQKCREYSKYVFVKKTVPILLLDVKPAIVDQCEFKDIPLIVGGDVARKSEFPHMALIGYEKAPGNIEWKCGGSLISEQHILVAAHCLFSRDLGEAKYVRLGLTNLTDYRHLQQYKIVERIAHPDYKPPLSYNNIAILKLENPAQMSPYVRPACLFQENIMSIDNAIATSWGDSGFDTDSDYKLLKNTMKFLNAKKCTKKYVNQGRRLPNGIEDDSQLCVEFPNPSTKDSCQRNSGGPLQIYHNSTDAYCMYDILGVASFGKACNLGNGPEVYTRTSHYIKWIEDTVWS